MTGYLPLKFCEFILSRMKVSFFFRKPFVGSYSLESIFGRLCDDMAAHDIEATRNVLPWYSRGILNRVRSVLWASRHQGDVNHVTGDVHFITCGLDPKRTVLTIHDLTVLSFYSGIRRRLLKLFWYDIPVRRCAVITTGSEQSKRHLLEHCPAARAARIVVIPNAVEPIFMPAPREFNIQRPRVLHVGTRPHKNLERLVEALANIPCRLHIIGELTETQRELLKKYRIDFEMESGLSEAAIYQAYCDSDLVSFASIAEGFGMPIVEAQCVERPVVTSNCSCMPEVAGPGACLVDPLDVKSIRQGIVRIIDDPTYRASLIDAGRKNRTRFDAKNIASQFAALYKDVYVNRQHRQRA